MVKAIASVGSLVVDVALSVHRVPLTGENLLARDFRMGPGGKGANAAAALARLGARSIMIGKVGADELAAREIDGLSAAGVDVSGVAAEPTAQTGVAVIMVNESRENTILVVPGANDLVDSTYVEGALQQREDILAGIIVDFEIPEEAVAAVIRFGNLRGVPVIVDAGPPRSYAAATWRDCAVLSPNEYEASAMVGFPVDTEEAALHAARCLRAQGAAVVLLKRGRAGALLLTNEDTYIAPAFDVPTVDTTGAGDAFTAMFALSVVEGRPLREAVRWACAAGALATTKAGTMPALPARAEVESFLAAGPRTVTP